MCCMSVRRSTDTDKPNFNSLEVPGGGGGGGGAGLYIGLLVQTNLFLRGVIVHRAAGTDKPISQGWCDCT